MYCQYTKATPEVAAAPGEFGHGASVAIGGLDPELHAASDWCQGLQLLPGLSAKGRLAGFRGIDAGQAHVHIAVALAYPHGVAIADGEHGGRAGLGDCWERRDNRDQA